jgi:tRNA A-37 threonylcarbamoyl transferase component Bud32
VSAPIQLQPGCHFAQDFRIESALKQGGMGAVYVATQLSTGTRRALKLMVPSLLADESARRRFEQEARIGARIPSEHVVQVIAAGVDPETASPWIAMEMLEGEELEERIRRAGPMAREEVRELFAQLCHAIGAAHRAGIVHRDLKPENVFLARPRSVGPAPFTVKVLDFGIAKVTSGGPLGSTSALGTPIWMAPEQTTEGGAISPATDVWALGLIAYFALTGKPFWRSANAAVPSLPLLLREVLVEPVPAAGARAAEHERAERLPSGFDSWFARCVTRQVELRFTNASEACAAFEAVLRGDPAWSHAEPAEDHGEAREVAGLPKRRRATPLVLAGAAITLIVAAAVAGAVVLRPDDRATGGSSSPSDPRAAFAAGKLSWQDLALPSSESASDPCDTSGMSVVVAPRVLFAGDPPRPLAALSPSDRSTGAPAAYKPPGRADDFLVLPVASALRERRQTRLLVIADAGTPYRLLYEVLFTARHAGYTRWDMLVNREGRPRTFVAYAPRGDAPTNEAGPRAKILVVRKDEAEVYVRRDGHDGSVDAAADGGASAWAPAGTGCEHEAPSPAHLRGRKDLSECLAALRGRLGAGLALSITAAPEAAYADVLVAVDEARAGDGSWEFAAPE